MRDMHSTNEGEYEKAPETAREYDRQKEREAFTEAHEHGMAVRQTPSGQMRIGSEIHLPEDTYGAAILAIMKEFYEIQSLDTPTTCVTLVKCIFAAVILLLNLLLQFSVLYFIEEYVVSLSVHHVQTTYAKFHRSFFTADGEFLQSEWDESPDKADLCDIAMTNYVFYVTVLFLWTISCLQEFRGAQRLVVNISNIPLVESGEDVFLDDPDSDKQSIVAITRPVRWTLYLAVCLPKIVISFMLLRLGLRWLSATASFEDMVMNAIAMTFVIQIDELLYSFAIPAPYCKQVAETSIFITSEGVPAATAEWKAYQRSIMYVVGALVFVIVYANFIQDVLPSTVYEAQSICRTFMESEFSPVCTRTWAEHARVFTQGLSAMSTEHCYPYGAPADEQAA